MAHPFKQNPKWLNERLSYSLIDSLGRETSHKSPAAALLWTSTSRFGTRTREHAFFASPRAIKSLGPQTTPIGRPPPKVLGFGGQWMLADGPYSSICGSPSNCFLQGGALQWVQTTPCPPDKWLSVADDIGLHAGMLRRFEAHVWRELTSPKRTKQFRSQGGASITFE